MGWRWRTLGQETWFVCSDNGPNPSSDGSSVIDALQSEYDSVVLECAGGVVGPLAAVAGGEAILPSLSQLLSPLIDRLVSPPLPLSLSQLRIISFRSPSVPLPTDHLL